MMSGTRTLGDCVQAHMAFTTTAHTDTHTHTHTHARTFAHAGLAPARGAIAVFAILAQVRLATDTGLLGIALGAVGASGRAFA